MVSFAALAIPRSLARKPAPSTLLPNKPPVPLASRCSRMVPSVTRGIPDTEDFFANPSKMNENWEAHIQPLRSRSHLDLTVSSLARAPALLGGLVLS